jgi:hypothetical protein
MYSIADTMLRIGDMTEARHLIGKADKIFKTEEGRRHWATGLGTIWLEAIPPPFGQRTIMAVEVWGTQGFLVRKDVLNFYLFLFLSLLMAHSGGILTSRSLNTGRVYTSSRI